MSGSQRLKRYTNVLTMAAGAIPAASDPPKFTSSGTAGADTAGVKSSLDLAGAGCANLDTVIEALTVGVAGDSVKFATAGDGTVAVPTFTFARAASVTTVTMHFLPGTTTVANVETAIAALTATASGNDSPKIIAVKTSGTAGNILTLIGDVLAATALAGGANPIGKGHDSAGFTIVEAIYHVSVSAWGALAGLALIPERCPVDDWDATDALWASCDPPGVRADGSVYLSIGASLILNNTLPVNSPIAVRVPCFGAKRVRLGVRNSAGAADPAAAASVSLELVLAGP